MPTPINQIYLSNTFTQWVSTTQSIVNRLTEIEYGSNSAQQLTIVGSGTRLSVANDSIFGTANVSGYFGVGGNTVISQNITVSGSNSTISGVNITANKIQLSSGSSVVSVYRGALANSAQIKWDESLKYWRLNDINTNNFYNIITSNNTATTTTSGVVQLYDGIGSSSTILAATANSISTVYNSISTVISPTLTLAYNQANSAYNQANAAYNQANSAYNQANSGITLTGISFDQANAAFNAANNAGSPAQITAAYNQANAAFFAANTANTRAANANNLTSGTISSSILGRSTLYIGTTGIALNRTSGSLVLNGITSIDGTATNITDYPITQNVSSNATTVRFASLGIGTNASGVTGEIRATNNITAYYSSDSRLKENIILITDPLSKVGNINGVYFDWTQDYIDSHGGEDGYFIRKHDIGVIAQEVEKELPELVGTREDGIKAVKYEKLTALLIEAVKELKSELDSVKSELETLKSKVN